MARITVELVRKRSEHNEGEISTLEELSLHQEDIEKIENLQYWCRDLRILLLQSNLISQIENLNKMKRLEYLNLALNNIEKIENLQGCESLEKLDLTLNFIGELSSIAALKQNIHLHTLYLVGNPCTEFIGYRDYVIATVPQLQVLDSEQILRSDRILAIQNYSKIAEKIFEQEEVYKVKREKQKQENHLKGAATKKLEELDDPEQIKKFWDEMCDNSPETRVELANVSRKQKDHEKKKNLSEDIGLKRRVRLFKDDGQPLSVNEARIPFTLNEDNDQNCLILTVETYRHLDTSLIEADVQPKYVRVTIKGKIFQIVLPEVVHPDKSSAQRSQTTGHLVIKMPLENPKIPTSKKQSRSSMKTMQPSVGSSKREVLEIGKADLSMDFSRIIEMTPKPMSNTCLLTCDRSLKKTSEKPVSESFQDNPEVPPLE